MTTRFDPFNEMDRLLGAMLRPDTSAAPMPLDLYKVDDHYVLSMDLPGVDPGSIDVNVEDRQLTVRAERTAGPAENVQWLSRERPSGTYARQLTVGRGLDLNQIDAHYADGVLTLTIPVAQDAKPRRITVQHSAGASERPNLEAKASTSAIEHDATA